MLRPLFRGVAISIEDDLSKSFRFIGDAAINKTKVSGICGVVARSSRTTGGGTYSLFNNANQSHPTLLTTLQQLLDLD